MPAKSKKPQTVDPGPSVVYWVAQQVSYSLRPEDMKVGLRIGICEHAFRTFEAYNLPPVSRFVAGMVTKVESDCMTITYDNPPEGVGLGLVCGLSYSKFCILNKNVETPKKKVVRKRLVRPTRFQREPVI